MSIQDRSDVDVAVDRIRSLTRTMARYKQTATRSQRNPQPGMNAVGRGLEETAKEIRKQYPDNASVQLAAQKFYNVWNGYASPSEDD